MLLRALARVERPLVAAVDERLADDLRDAGLQVV